MNKLITLFWGGFVLFAIAGCRYLPFYPEKPYVHNSVGGYYDSTMCYPYCLHYRMSNPPANEFGMKATAIMWPNWLSQTCFGGLDIIVNLFKDGRLDSVHPNMGIQRDVKVDTYSLWASIYNYYYPYEDNGEEWAYFYDTETREVTFKKREKESDPINNLEGVKFNKTSR